LVSSPARSYRRADATNQFVLNFPVNSGSGVKLGQAITISALLIQGPFPKEDKTDHQEHRRQVQSAMLNVYSDGQIAAFVAAGLKFQEEMQLYCLQRVEVSRVTKQRAVASLQKFLNATFFSSKGCFPEHRGTRDFIVIALRLSINVWLFWQRISDLRAQHPFFIAGRRTTDRTSMTDCALTIPRLQEPTPARVNPTVGR
jgi:hypothetical protein